MEIIQVNKKKIINDPVYGFITLPDEIIFDIIEHPWFQRLRRIKQLGLTHLVYPGALHTRFHHVLGAMNLMSQSLEVLESKGNNITRNEKRAVLLAILLHDIGHGPYSHTLEGELINDLSHEAITLIFINHLEQQFGEDLKMVRDIFTNNYPKKFLHQLVSGQLDMDRLDYLKRDSFFTGVSEGVINTDRIITMLDVVDDGLVVEAKGIYSIDKFIVARRLMYWQVYLHKTVLAAEHLLRNIIRRARFLAQGGANIFSTTALRPFLYTDPGKLDIEKKPELLQAFARLDDYDIFACIKEWAFADDKVLSMLCRNLVNRHLFKTEIVNQPIAPSKIDDLRQHIARFYKISNEEAAYFVIYGQAHNNAYNPLHERINIVFRDGSVKDYSDVSDQVNADVLLQTVSKYFLCYPKLFGVEFQR